MGFKVDSSFLRFVTMGALGSKQVAAQMEGAGLRPIELERYSCSNKIWAKKVKRLRLPDLLCLRTGTRVEVRTKSNLEIKMSEAPQNPERRWFSGLRQEDIIAFIYCDTSNENSLRIAESAELFRVSELIATENQSRLGPPKSASEGAERDRSWPATVPKHNGRVTEVGSERIRTQLESGRRQTYRLNGRTAYVTPGSEFLANCHFIAGIPTSKTSLPDPQADQWDPNNDIASDNSIDRYVAVKALGYLGNQETINNLLQIYENDLDSRVSLEAAGSAARLGSAEALERILDTIRNPAEDYLSMEGVFILTEIGRIEPARLRVIQLLIQIASDNSYTNSEIRQAAIWGLGKAGCKAYSSLVPFFSHDDLDERTHALFSFAGDCTNVDIDSLVDLLIGEEADNNTKSCASFLLSQVIEPERSIARLEHALRHHQENSWLLASLGQISPTAINTHIGNRALLERIRPLQILTQEYNWTKNHNILESLNFLRKQGIY